jgi:hypothetical protein
MSMLYFSSAESYVHGSLLYLLLHVYLCMHATYLALSFKTSSRNGKYRETIGCFPECIYKYK